MKLTEESKTNLKVVCEDRCSVLINKISSGEILITITEDSGLSLCQLQVIGTEIVYKDDDVE